MRTPAQPRINLYTQVSPATDKLRRRLQAQTGLSACQLVTEALHLFADKLASSARKNHPWEGEL